MIPHIDGKVNRRSDKNRPFGDLPDFLRKTVAHIPRGWRHRFVAVEAAFELVADGFERLDRELHVVERVATPALFRSPLEAYLAYHAIVKMSIVF